MDKREKQLERLLAENLVIIQKKRHRKVIERHNKQGDKLYLSGGIMDQIKRIETNISILKKERDKMINS
jgi:preprotein translocase subunit YajC